MPHDELDDTTDRLARRIAAGPRMATAETKRLLRIAAGRDLDAQVHDEFCTVADLSRTEDWREGVAAFRERRDPQFG